MKRLPHASAPDGQERTLSAYVYGFLLSLYLTLLAYTLAVHRSLHAETLIVTLAALAFLQFIVQLRFFLHLGHESKPRWHLAAFWFMVLTVSILVVGSLWIMYNLNYHMDVPQGQVNQYLQSQDGL